ETPPDPMRKVYDCVIYGVTCAGIAAAVHAARSGLEVILLEPSSRLGGVTASGLGASDIGEPASLGGLAAEFYRRVDRYYRRADSWRFETREEYVPKHPLNVDEKRDYHFFFEPRVALAIFKEMLAEETVEVRMRERLRRRGGISRDKGRIRQILLESGRVIEGRYFVDATYEGDLMAAAGVSFLVGRESCADFGEEFNGIRPIATAEFDVDPFVAPGDPSSGLLPGLRSGRPGPRGAGDDRLQAYNFRLCLTDVSENSIPIEKPLHYDPLNYELLVRHINSKPHLRPGASLFKLTPMPNRKTDSNNHGFFSTDYVGQSHAWPEAEYAERERLWEAHRNYTQGFFWFLGNDRRAPEEIRREVLRWGLAADEFEENDHWPPQLYVREARRMRGEYTVDEHDCRGARRADDPIAYGSYAMDSHEVSRFVDEEGILRIEGAFWLGIKPYPISYRAILPRMSECENLLVPICLSATHAAYGSIRMEPVFMMLGQAAAVAVGIALKDNLPVQKISYPALSAVLEREGSVAPATI
ncbi:MAG: FAD-dependent oxidoreductase, partial [Opitutales bacterium]